MRLLTTTLSFALVTLVAWVGSVEVARLLPIPHEFGVPAFVALCVGLAQAAVLSWARAPRAWLWVAATVGGALIAEIVLSRIGFSHPILALPLGALVTGTCQGALQAFVLRSRTWFAVASIAFFTGGIALVSIGTLRTMIPTFSLRELATFAATVGLIEGLALAMLRRE